MTISRKSARNFVWRWIAFVVIACLTIATQPLAYTQQDRADVEVLRIRPNFYLIARAGGNIGVQVGDNGVVVVDSGTAQTMYPEYRKMLKNKSVAPAKCERFCCGWIAPLPNGIPPGLNCNQYGFVAADPKSTNTK